MKAYGLPRILDVQWPDRSDLGTYALKTRAGRLDGHSHTRSIPKRATRRYWKRAARRANRAAARDTN